MRARHRLALVSLAGILSLASPARGQSEGLLEIEGDLQRFLARQHALGRLPWLDTGALPLATADALRALDSLAAHVPPTAWTAGDRHLLASWRGERAGGVLGPRLRRGAVYRDNRSFGRLTGDGYAVELAPLLDLGVGPAFRSGPVTIESPAVAWTNTRGFRAAASIGRFFSEVRISENQQLAPVVQRQVQSAPRRAYVAYAPPDDPVYDFMSSTGVVGYRTPLFEARAGRDRARLGFARGSLLLSNFAAEYDHAQVRWTLGPLSFQSLYARFADPEPRNDRLAEFRHGAFHRLAARLGRGVEVEFFEGVIAGGRDAEGQRRGLDPAYLVPFQLYRAVERDIGSPDNVFLGAGAAWTVGPGFRLYGQGLLDEFEAARFFEDSWRSKWGAVVGLQVSDPAIPGVGRLRDTDLRVEYARIRPYVYSHRDSSTAAVHYRDVLGHPAGPNASDVHVRLAHRPMRDVEVSLDLSHTVRGRDSDSLNFGGDAYRPYGEDRAPEPNPTLQGVRQRLLLADVRATVRLAPHLVAGTALHVQRIADAETGTTRAVVPSVFLRWSLAEFGARY